MTENANRDQMSTRETKLSEGELRKGTHVISGRIADDYTPPSASLKPAAAAKPTSSSDTASASGAEPSAGTSSDATK